MDQMLRDPVKPTVPEVLPYVRALYQRDGGGAGCCLHILLDDGNVGQGHAQFCYGVACGREHRDCTDLAKLLTRMSATQHRRFYADSAKYDPTPTPRLGEAVRAEQIDALAAVIYNAHAAEVHRQGYGVSSEPPKWPVAAPDHHARWWEAARAALSALPPPVQEQGGGEAGRVTPPLNSAREVWREVDGVLYLFERIKDGESSTRYISIEPADDENGVTLAYCDRAANDIRVVDCGPSLPLRAIADVCAPSGRADGK